MKITLPFCYRPCRSAAFGKGARPTPPAAGGDELMAKILVEFINTCPSCDGYTRIVREAAARHADSVECRIYYAGRDFDYISKYGVITRGTLVVDGRIRVEDLSRRTIEAAIDEAASRAGP